MIITPHSNYLPNTNLASCVNRSAALLKAGEKNTKLRFVNAVHKVISLFSRDPNTGKVIKGAYVLCDHDRLEFFDKKHRYRETLGVIYDVWNRAVKMNGMSYWDFLELSEAPDRAHLQHLLNSHNILLKDGDLDVILKTDMNQGRIHYLSQEELQKYKATFKNDNVNKIFNVRGEQLGDGQYIIVLGPDREFYINKKIKGHFQHSSFFAGKSVLCAGEIIIEKGIINKFILHSGHYRPDQKAALKALQRFEELGLNISQFAIEGYEKNGKTRIGWGHHDAKIWKNQF
jgi:hypothetical protein